MKDRSGETTEQLEKEFGSYLKDLSNVIPNRADLRVFLWKHNSLRGIWKELEKRGIKKSL